ncbi:MAG TPA: hypothetical protein PKW55_08560 [Spirochaetota bacterium]|nr:hypothetical protein [Spirochaetota bacterium]HOM39120.1 hypothetical protein [Spirochaetota bacterium]HPQ50003.1 hypothetical protein [Spirochaetota bacterium]
MFDFFQKVFLPFFFETKEKNNFVNQVTLYVVKEIKSYIETPEGKIKEVINRVESPKVLIYEGKVKINPNKIREIINDPINNPQKDPSILENAITFEQKDMISSIHDIINNTLENFTTSSKLLLNSFGIFID